MEYGVCEHLFHGLRRWRGLLYRVRDVDRAAGALVCLGRWLHRVPV